MPTISCDIIETQMKILHLVMHSVCTVRYTTDKTIPLGCSKESALFIVFEEAIFSPAKRTIC